MLRKGKNLEVADEFKSLVCFKCIDDEKDQDRALDKWDKLCDEFKKKDVGRSCMIIA